jgi:hypothetical protein
MSATGNRKRAEWVSAAELTLRMSQSQVECPECGEKTLQVRDVEYGTGPCRGLNRYLLCGNCRGFNAINLRHARALVPAPQTPAE